MAPMGSSAGRSRGNRTGEGAVRRNTERERAHVDPVTDTAEVSPLLPRDYRWQLTEKGHQLLDLAAWAMWISFIVFCNVILYKALGWL